MTFKAGDWVENKKYGVGKVEEDKGSERYQVRFVSCVTVIKGDFLSAVAAPYDPTPWNPPAKSGKGAGGRRSSGRRFPLVPFERFVAGFLRTFPLGFEDPAFENGERREKREAAEFVQRELSPNRVRGALSAGDFASICKSAHEAIQMTNLIFRQEKIMIMPKLRADEYKETLARGLVELLYGDGPEEQRFEQWVSIISQHDAAKWPVATYFPFFATDGAKMFMKPEPMQKMEGSAGVSLEYQSLPNWRTYSKLQEMAQVVDAKLREHGLVPRNGLDVQGFIWAATRIEDGDYDKGGGKYPA